MAFAETTLTNGGEPLTDTELPATNAVRPTLTYTTESGKFYTVLIIRGAETETDRNVWLLAVNIPGGSATLSLTDAETAIHASTEPFTPSPSARNAVPSY